MGARVASLPVLQSDLAPDWALALAPLAEEFDALAAFLAADPRGFLPAPDLVLRAFRQPMSQVRVLIVGQDPYPTPGHAVGLAFSTASHVRPIPRSLKNIFAELHTDLGIMPPASGNLGPWAEQGVLLLNRVLTVAPGEAGSHAGRGWEAITEAAIRALVARDAPLVAILWGKHAQTLAPLLGSTPIIASAHPSPLSARRGFFGSRPFSRANDALAGQCSAPVDWRIGALEGEEWLL